jgi:hypothetical protein
MPCCHATCERRQSCRQQLQQRRKQEPRRAPPRRGSPLLSPWIRMAARLSLRLLGPGSSGRQPTPCATWTGVGCCCSWGAVTAAGLVLRWQSTWQVLSHLLACCPLHTAAACRPFAPFKETGSWRGCVVCWSGEAPAGSAVHCVAAAAAAAAAKPTALCLPGCLKCQLHLLASLLPLPPHCPPGLLLALPCLQTRTRCACCPATPATARPTATACSPRWRSCRSHR